MDNLHLPKPDWVSAQINYFGENAYAETTVDDTADLEDALAFLAELQSIILHHQKHVPLKQVRQWHDRAMHFAQKAQVAAEIAANEEDEHNALLLRCEALYYEQNAVMLIPDSQESEPTWSILHMSAASLAFACGDSERQQQFAERGLKHTPSDRIRLVLESLKKS